MEKASRKFGCRVGCMVGAGRVHVWESAVYKETRITLFFLLTQCNTLMSASERFDVCFELVPEHRISVAQICEILRRVGCTDDARG